MSALGQKRTLKRFHPMSALPPKVDVPHPRALFMGEAVGAVILGPAKTVALSEWVCARGRGASGEVLGFLRHALHLFATVRPDDLPAEDQSHAQAAV